MTNNNFPPDLMEYIKGLEKRIASLERRPRAGLTSVDTGSFTANDNDGSPLAIIGEHVLYNVGAGATFDGTAFYRTGSVGSTPGILAASFGRSSAESVDILRIYDKDGSEIISDDVLNGGLARPYVGCGFANADYTTWANTTSSTFGDASVTDYIKQHPKIFVGYAIYADAADTAGELQVIADSVQVGSTAVYTAGIGPGSILTGSITGLVAGDLQSVIDLRVQVRRTAGTGNVYGVGRSVYGIQT